MRNLRAACLAWLLAAPVALALGEEPPTFVGDVAPMLARHCQRCHGAEEPKAGLDVTSPEGIARGGESGPAIVPGDSEQSLLVQMLAARQMPPEGEGRLSDAEIELVRLWTSTSARTEIPEASVPASAIDPAARDFPAFRRLVPPQVPAVVDASSRSPIDAFVSARLAAQGLSLSPPADRPTLLRRAYFDLLGLPPTPEEIDAFASDLRSDAYERLLDRLMASPHFGERWGRHWLDAAGYSDITGGDNDAGIIKLSDGKWKYRDYVVRSFNQDKPLDRFLVEQLAGDELVDWRNAQQFTPEIEELLIATGYLRGAADDTDEKELNTPDITNGVLQRTSEVVANGLLGLTVGCAKCHDHKYEPIPQRDYYALLATFTPIFNTAAWVPPKDRALADIAPARKAEAQQHNAEVDRQVAELKATNDGLRKQHRQPLFDAKLAAVPELIRADVRTAVEDTPADKRTEVQKYLAEKFGPALKVSDEEIKAAMSDAVKQQLAENDGRAGQLAVTRRSWGTIQAAYDSGPAPLTRLLRRGNYLTPGAAVAPGFLSVLCTDTSAAPDQAGNSSLQPAGATSGRRLALARWVTDWQSPAGGLAARVYVNRAWQALFGHGIVETTENLGKSGATPSHPELFEWLACRFVADGRKIKPLLKQIMMSAVYCQASADSPLAAQSADPQLAQAPPGAAIDPTNRLLWHMPLKRLQAEIVRDAILSASGQIDLSLGGPPLPLENRPDGSVVIKEKELPTPNAACRRSLYVLARRNYHLSILNVFDQPAMAMNCPHREQSAVVLQSLTMLNDEWVHTQAEHFARRVLATSRDESPQSRIEQAFRIALARSPLPSETEWSRQLLEQHAAEATAAKTPGSPAEALAQLCHMLLNSNEFLYVP